MGSKQNRYEDEATEAFLSQPEWRGLEVRHACSGGEWAITDGRRPRKVDGAVWLSGAADSSSSARVVLVQTKAVLTSSLLGQALYSRLLVESRGDIVERSIALCAEATPELKRLANEEPFASSIEVLERPKLFGEGAIKKAHKGMARWTSAERHAWLADTDATTDRQVPGGTSYDVLCATIPLADGGTAFVGTQKRKGMSVLGRVLTGWLAYRAMYPTPHHLIAVVRSGYNDLDEVARSGTQRIQFVCVAENETAAETLHGLGLKGRPSTASAR